MLHSQVSFILVLCVSVLLLRPARSDDFDDLLAKKKRAVNEVAVALAREMPIDTWCKATEDCTADCSTHACSGGSFGSNYKCSSEVQLGSQTDTCKDFDNPNGVLLSLDRTFIWTPPGSVSTKGDDSDIVISDFTLRRDVCALKKIENEILEAHKKNDVKEWLYAATTTGGLAIYPGRALPRPENTITDCGFNPASRKWYISAASGTKDIVFLLDTTSLLTASTKLFLALKQTVERLDGRDYFAIVAYGSGNPMPLGGSDGLQRATQEVKDSFQDELKSIRQSSGSPNVSAAFEEAFNVLDRSENSENSSKCSKLVVLLSGRDDGCFTECDDPSSECKCVERVREVIRKGQEKLSNSTSIVTFTEGDNINGAERLARTIACDQNNRGIWRRVSDDDTEDTAMSTYSQIVAASLFSESPTVFSSETYEDVGGLGEIFTLAVAVYSNNEQRLVGVTGADITLKEVIDVVGTEKEAREKILELSNESRDCSRYTERNSCELQALRSQKNSAICADILPKRYTCLKFGSSSYLRMPDATSWEQAKAACNGLNGSTLVKIDTAKKNEILSGIAPADGIWIGLQGKKNADLLWQDGSSLEYNEFGFDGEAASSAVHNETNGDSCVTMDRRGVSGNWNVESCNVIRPSICELSAVAFEEQCGEDIIFDVENPPAYDVVNAVDCRLIDTSRSCSEEQEEATKNAKPLCKETKSDYSWQDRSCCGGQADRGASKKVEPSPEGGDGGLSTGGIVGIVIGCGVGAIVVIGGIVIGFRKYRATGKETEGREGGMGTVGTGVGEGGEEVVEMGPNDGDDEFDSARIAAARGGAGDVVGGGGNHGSYSVGERGRDSSVDYLDNYGV